MVKSLRVHQYKKFRDHVFKFEPGVNAISGPNGTCKTTLLHMISNSYQAVTSKDVRLTNRGAIPLINSLNAQVNMKIERLAKGSLEYNDPAPGLDNGSLYVVEYEGGSSLAFRKHNSEASNRYAVKPFYKRKNGDHLPSAPVIYLGLSRIYPWGEFVDDETVRPMRTKPDSGFVEELAGLYLRATGLKARRFVPQSMGSVRKRQEFDTDAKGVDSNTVSSGEDNVLTLLTALLSLKQYYCSLTEEAQKEEVASILLVDEFDATLHPSLQYELLDLAEEFSAKYHIQVIFTTHSLVLIERMFKKKMNVIYLMNNGDVAVAMPDPDPMKIEGYLKDKTKDDLLSDRIIPVFTEDAQARLFYNLVMGWLCEASEGFLRASRRLHLIDANFGSNELRNLFKDTVVRQSTMSSICLLDGDQNPDLPNHIITLPGKLSPEWVAFKHAEELTGDGRNTFWTSQTVIDEGFSYDHYVRRVQPKIDHLPSDKKERREGAKSIFNDNVRFFELVLKDWVISPNNADEVVGFAKNLEIMYRKTAIYHSIYISSSEDFTIKGKC